MIGTLINVLFFAVPLLVLVATESVEALVITGVLALIFTICNLVSFLWCANDQIKDIEEIKECEGDRVIYERQRDELITPTALYLGEKYPEHEKEIFKCITEQDSKAAINVLGSMPKIQSGEMFKKLVNDIQTLNKSVYSRDLRIEALKKTIRVRSRNFWTPRCLIPKYEE